MLREKDLFLPSGYANMAGIMSIPASFVICIGGRGTGKTFGALQHLTSSGDRWIYIRRTKTQLEMIDNPEFSPFNALNRECGTDFIPARITKGMTGIYHSRTETTKDGLEIVKPDGSPVGYLAALTSFSAVRGFDAYSIKTIVYDEFIKEPHEKIIKGEGDALLNAYETINRNREFDGADPLKLVMLSNSVDLGNPYFVTMGIVTEWEQMLKKRQRIRLNRDRGICLIDLSDSPISQRKKTTSLYKMTHGTDFYKMSVENDFGVNEDLYRSRSLTEYKPVLTIGELTLYKHKSQQRYYCSPHKSGSPRSYGTSTAELTRFRALEKWVVRAYVSRLIDFETYYTEILLTEYLKI